MPRAAQTLPARSAQSCLTKVGEDPQLKELQTNQPEQQAAAQVWQLVDEPRASDFSTPLNSNQPLQPQLLSSTALSRDPRSPNDMPTLLLQRLRPPRHLIDARPVQSCDWSV